MIDYIRGRTDRRKRLQWWEAALALVVEFWVPLMVIVGLLLLIGCEAPSWPAVQYRAPDLTEQNLEREREAAYVRANVAAVKRRYRT
jgi:hypothetical protein